MGVHFPHFHALISVITPSLANEGALHNDFMDMLRRLISCRIIIIIIDGYVLLSVCPFVRLSAACKICEVIR